MESKLYNTFEEIERDLQILKLEREIHHKKIILHIEQISEVQLRHEIGKHYQVQQNEHVEVEI